MIVISLHSIVSAQLSKKASKLDVYYLPWSVKGLGTSLDDTDIKTDKYCTHYSINDTSLITEFYSSVNAVNLKKSKQTTLDVRMVVEIYNSDSLLDVYSIGQPIIIKHKILETDTIKPPFFIAENKVFIGFLNIRISGIIYRSNFELTKFILENIPEAKISGN